MVAVLNNPAIARMARPAPLPGGLAREERVVFGGVGWAGYLALDEALGHDCPGPRCYFLNGDLETMSTSDEHERIKKRIGGCVEDFLVEKGIPHVARGEATMQHPEHAAAEPDESWCIGEEKQFPDIVLEIALTSGGLPKLRIYQRFAVREVWLWRAACLEIHCLLADGSGYERAEASRLLPALPIAALEAAVAERDALTARRAFRAAL